MPETPEQLAHKPVLHPALTTPCSVLDLHNWLISVQGVTSGDHRNTTLTSSGTSLTIS